MQADGLHRRKCGRRRAFMLYGIGCDLCEIAHLEKSLTGAHAAAFIRRVYGEAERAALSLDEPLPAGRSAAHRLASASSGISSP